MFKSIIAGKSVCIKKEERLSKLPKVWQSKTKTRKTLILRVLQFKEVVPPGIEPGTHGFSVHCSTD